MRSLMFVIVLLCAAAIGGAVALQVWCEPTHETVSPESGPPVAPPPVID